MYMQVQCVLCCMVYSPGFHGTSDHEKNGGVAIDEPPRGPANGPVGRSWNRAFCYGLPVLYKLFWLLLIVNDSTPVFTCNSTIMWSYHRVLNEIPIIMPAYWSSSSSLYCMMPKVVKIRKVETCKYGEVSWSLTKVRNNNNNNNNNNNVNNNNNNFAVALRPNAGHGLLILEVSRLHTTTHHSR
jgi:hypothetical protein